MTYTNLHDWSTGSAGRLPTPGASTTALRVCWTLDDFRTESCHALADALGQNELLPKLNVGTTFGWERKETTCKVIIKVKYSGPKMVGTSCQQMSFSSVRVLSVWCQ